MPFLPHSEPGNRHGNQLRIREFYTYRYGAYDTAFGSLQRMREQLPRTATYRHRFYRSRRASEPPSFPSILITTNALRSTTNNGFSLMAAPPPLLVLSLARLKYFGRGAELEKRFYASKTAQDRHM